MYKTKKKIKFIIVPIFFVLLALYLIIGFCQTDLKITEYTYHNAKVPEEFDNYKIVLISDLHNKIFGKHQSNLLQAIQDSNPDLILLTGDIIDEKHTDLSGTEDFICGISAMAPCYFVSGNHELLPAAEKQYEGIEALFRQYGVIDLDNAAVEITKGNSVICLHGQKFCSHSVTEFLEYADETKFNILMYHCSDYFNLISDYGYDIIMSGHTHGGIIRLPFVGGVIGNHGDLFPKYDGGVFMENNCTLFSSRGLGDAAIPRFYNPPEVVVITLRCQ